MKVGKDLASRLLGGDLGNAISRTESLGALLGEPEMRQTTELLATRMNRIRDRFAEKFPEAAEDLFRGASRALTAEESSFLRKIATQELDRGFVRFLPARAAGAAPYSASRQAFLDVTAVAAATPVVAPLARLQQWTRNSEVADTFAAYEQLRIASPEIETLFPRKLIYRLLADEEMTGTTARLRDVLRRYATGAATDDQFNSLAAQDRLTTAIREMLVDKIPARSIAARVRGLRLGSTLALTRALGDMTLKETQLLMHGGNPLAPTADSLLGKYLAETGAETVVRSFTLGNGAVAGVGEGPRRLVVSISEQTLPIFKKYFSAENFFGHLHTPNQGTLFVVFKGLSGSYAQLNSELRSTSEGTIIPMILLKSTEGQRLGQYFRLGAEFRHDLAQYPWRLENRGAPYCATGGYTSCTHWFGDIPIGDTLVTEYRFPGAIDQHAANRIPDSPAPRVQPLRAHAHPSPLAQRVWKTPGSQQLAGTLGLEAQNLAGELANPGWVAHSLLGAASVDRVPVVFRFAVDARAPIAPDFDMAIHSY